MSSSARKSFFASTQSVDDRFGELSSFTWASYAGLKELWWQARGFQNQFPDLHVNAIKARFLSTPGVPGNVDVHRILLARDWELNEAEFAKSLLFGACTLYESWAEQVCGEIFTPATAADAAKCIQFPADPTVVAPNGYQKAVQRANQQRSSLMHSEILPVAAAATANCWATVNEHLVAYRYFKECRNAFIHSSGHATAKTVAAFHSLKSIPTAPGSRPFRHQFKLPPIALDKKIDLHLGDVTLFNTVARRLIYTFDAAFCVSEKAEAQLEQRLRGLKVGRGASKWISMPAKPQASAARVQRMLHAARVPVPANVGTIQAWMAAKGI